LNQLISVYQADYEIFNFDLAGTLWHLRGTSFNSLSLRCF
jgi:hypothetical protein